MDLISFVGFSTQTAAFTWLVLPLLIFCARILDVSIGTIRVIFISRGIIKLAPLISFLEILIWITTISQIMHNLHNFVCYIAYAGGFAAGTYVGLAIEHKLSLGQRLIRVITKKPAIKLIETLKNAHYGITSVEAIGTNGKVHLVFMVVRRHNIQEVIDMIKHYNPQAFYTIEDVYAVNGGNFPHPEEQYNNSLRRLRLFHNGRKGK